MAHDGRAAALAVVAGAGLLLGGAGVANANQTLSFAVQQSTTASQTLDFDQFDTTLGTLTEVDILLSGSAIGLGSDFSLTGGEGSGVAAYTAQLNVIGPASTVELGGAAHASAQCSEFNGDGCNSGLQGPTLSSAIAPNPAAITNTSLFAPFEGTGTVGLTAAIQDFDLDNSCSPFEPDPGSCSYSNDLSWSGTLEVSYVYTPAAGGTAVPEPASLALFGGGLLALAGLRRRF
jgi:hypothetical protein